ncbi:MAG: hypothetical protein P8R42_26765 [Candidatus Binatia bacterium]|nr:hypothetical protein [Candidatus Binatia bacterium]
MSDGNPGAGGASDVVRDRPEPLDRTDIWLGFAVVAVAVAFQWPIHDRWLSLQDEGYILAIADDLNRGKVLYRDVTSDAPFPGAFYLLSWWFRFTGPSVESTRILAMGGFALYCAAIYRISRELLSRRWCFGVVFALLCYRVWAFPHWHIYSYSLVSAVLMTTAVALVCVYRRTRSLGYVLIAGLCAGAGIMSKQNYGLAVTGSLGLALLILPWLDAKKRPTFFGALLPGATLGLAALAIVVPSILYFASQGALEAMIDQTWVFPFTLMDKLHFTALPDLWPLWGQDSNLRAEIGSYFPAILATLWWYPCPGCFVSEMSSGPLYLDTAFWDVTLKLFYWAPILSYFTAATLWGTKIIRGRMAGDDPDYGERRLLLLAFAGGFLLAFNKPRDWVHLMMVYPPSITLGAVLLYDTMRTLPTPARRATGAVTAFVMVCTLGLSIALMIDLRHRINWPLDMPRGGVYGDPQNGPIIQDVVEYLDAAAPPGTPVPVYPVQPMLGFLAGRTTAGGYYVVWPSQNENRDEKIIADFENKGITNVIYSVSQYQHLGAFRTNAPKLFDHLVENFEVERVFSRETHGPIVMGLRLQVPPPSLPIPLAGQLRKKLNGAKWETWSFDEVLTQPVGRRTRLMVFVPEKQTLLNFGFGVNPDRWLDVKGGPFTFRMVLKEPLNPARHVLFERDLDPAMEVEDRAWNKSTVDLAAFAGKAVILELSVRSEREEPSPQNLVGWKSPYFLAPRASVSAIHLDG